MIFAFICAIKKINFKTCNTVISLQSPKKSCCILIVDFYQLVVLAA